MKESAIKVSRILVGALFIISGLIKANDTIGFGYKLEEYFDVFHIPVLGQFATAIAMLLCTIEVVLGALLLLGFWARKVTVALLATIIFFTFLTFVSAVFKVVTSCGCFGDAIPLTPWESFSKDLILLILIVYLYINRLSITPLVHKVRIQQFAAGLLIMLTLLFCLYTYNALPVVDFLPYKLGANIPALMKIPEGAKPDEYEMIYRLKNKATGETKEINDKEYLKSGIWKDNNWEITGTPDRKLVKKGYEVKIKDLNISDASGTDYTKELIENPYYNLIVVVYDLNKTNEAAIAEINRTALKAAEQYNIRTVLLTSNSAQDAAAFVQRNKLLIEVFYADAVPLKSMVRANPGILLLKNGVVINKWHYHTMPVFEKLAEDYFNK
jgi:uncharacterized membrane protein YphA (DoxX/SURF4 family)